MIINLILIILNKLADEYNSTYYGSIDQNLIDADCFTLFEEIEMIPKDPKFNIGDTITKYKNIFDKAYTENWSKEIFVTDSVLKTSTYKTYKI